MRKTFNSALYVFYISVIGNMIIKMEIYAIGTDYFFHI